MSIFGGYLGWVYSSSSSIISKCLHAFPKSELKAAKKVYIPTTKQSTGIKTLLFHDKKYLKWRSISTNAFSYLHLHYYYIMTIPTQRANLINSLLSSSPVSVLTLTALQRSFILSDNIAHLSRAEMATPQEKSYYWP